MCDIKNQHLQFYSSINNANTESILKWQVLAIVNGIYDPLGPIILIYSRSKDTFDKIMGISNNWLERPDS